MGASPKGVRPPARLILMLSCLTAMIFMPCCASSPGRPPAAKAPESGPVVNIILLDPVGGPKGGITITNSVGSRDLSRSNQALRIDGPGSPPGEPFLMTDAEVASRFGEALSAQPAAPARFILYFKPDSSELTEESQKLIAAIIDAMSERRPADVSVVGNTDTVGDASYNFELGLARARAVADILAARGVIPGSMDISSHGEENLLVRTPDNTAEPRNRRVEVTVR